MADGKSVLAIVMMGVSGSGKTTIGRVLATKISATFADADDYHSTANKAKMAAGHPLTDGDRAPWLKTLNDVLQGWVKDGKRGILACSALKAGYRQTLSAGVAADKIAFVWLDGSKEIIAERMQARQNHFMHADMLESQLATLEPPAEATRIVNDRTPDEVAGEIVTKLSL